MTFISKSKVILQQSKRWHCDNSKFELIIDYNISMQQWYKKNRPKKFVVKIGLMKVWFQNNVTRKKLFCLCLPLTSQTSKFSWNIIKVLNCSVLFRRAVLHARSTSINHTLCISIVRKKTLRVSVSWEEYQRWYC